MRKLHSTFISSSGLRTSSSGLRTRSLVGALTPTRMLAACLFASLYAFTIAAQVRPVAQGHSQQPAQAGKQTQQSSDADEDDERESGESESKPKAEARMNITDPATIMRRARFIRVHSDSVFLSEQEIEDSLRKRKEFQAWGMVITRNDSDADLFIEVTRKSLTRRFTFTVLDPRTMEVVASGKTRSVIFGKKISNKIAEKFANRVKLVRPYPPATGSTP